MRNCLDERKAPLNWGTSSRSLFSLAAETVAAETFIVVDDCQWKTDGWSSVRLLSSQEAREPLRER